MQDFYQLEYNTGSDDNSQMQTVHLRPHLHVSADRERICIFHLCYSSTKYFKILCQSESVGRISQMMLGPAPGLCPLSECHE